MRKTTFMTMFLTITLLLSGCSDDEKYQEPAEKNNYTNTGLPVVYINTHSGEEVANKDVYEGATIEICDGNSKYNLNLQNIQIHGRGNSSWYTFIKKRSYTIKLDSKQGILGMPKDKKWCLIANYRDKTMLRNSVAWWLSAKLDIHNWTPRYRFVELVLNGTHRGTYQLVEQVKINDDRININEMSKYDTSPDKISGGYIIELDRGTNEDQWEWIMPNMHGDVHKLSIKEPKIDDGNESQFKYIYSYLMNIDRLFGENKIAEVMGNYIDMESWAAQWLIFEISGTPEPNGPNSWYTYKDINNDKWYCGPVWDFDYKSFIPSTSNKWINRNVIYMPEMLKYEPFRETLKEVWSRIKPMLPELIAFIEQEGRLIELSEKLNWEIHNKNLIEDNRTENGDEFVSPQAARIMMIDYLKAKWEFIDNNLENI